MIDANDLEKMTKALDGGKLIDDSNEWAETLHAAAAMLREQAREIEALRADPAGWRPIESAPKDGTSIDVWADDLRVADAFWAVPRFGNKAPQWCKFVYDNSFGWGPGPIIGEPAYWMPLRAAPATFEAGG